MKFLFCILFSFFAQYIYSQSRISVTKNDTLDSRDYSYLLDFENIEYRNYILKSSEFKNKEVRIFFYEYFNNIDIQKGELDPSTIINDKRTPNDSTINIKLFHKIIGNDSIKIALFTSNKNIHKKVVKGFNKIDKMPESIEFGNDLNPLNSKKEKLYFQIRIRYLNHIYGYRIDQLYAFEENKRFSGVNHDHEDSPDMHYIVFEFVFE
ncbi:MAG: hypothetical protein V4548_02950 [Bacteroidota bacterium]